MTQTSSSARTTPESFHGFQKPLKTPPENPAGDFQGGTCPTDADDTETPQNRPNSDAFDARYLEPSPHRGDEGELVGRDPRKIPTADLQALGHPTSVKKAIRAKCMDCAGSDGEIRKCVQFDCPLWHMRMGNNPLHGKT